jgi:redox-sensitive bicupin YhaK (pirin superfamily)
MDVRMEAGAVLDLAADGGGRGAYLISGRIACGGQSFDPAQMLVLRTARRARLRAEIASRLVLIGGDPFPEPRHVWWNFASSSRERIEQAKRDWRERRGEPDGPFPLVPGDETEFIPLPES